nr:reverse transcriptase domain-containing protein [Tanacetum cinerariifolium]
CSSLRSLKPKCTIESKAKRSSKIISLGHYSIRLASSHTVKSKTDIKSLTHYPCGIARTSKSHADPTLLNDFEMTAEGPDDLPVPDLRTMEELGQPSLNGRGGPIVPIAIQATKFGLKNDMIQQVHNSCQFHGLLGDDANKYLDKFLHVTQSIKVNGVTDDSLRFYLFPHSLTYHATAWFDRGTFMKRRLEECYDLIENMTAHHNDWDNSAQRRAYQSNSYQPQGNRNLLSYRSDNYLGPPGFNQNQNQNNQNQNFHNQNRNQGNNHHPQGNNQERNQFFHGTSHDQNPPPAYQAPAYQALPYQAPAYQASVHQPHIPQPQVVTTNEFTNFTKANDAILKNMQTNMTSLKNLNFKLKNMFGQFMKMNTASSSGLGTLPASVKAVKEICVTCGGAHPYYQCLAAGGNTFPELREYI